MKPLAFLLAAALAMAAAPAERYASQVEPQMASLTALYKDLHEHPEVSNQEERTAGVIAGELRSAGYTVATGIGNHGVVGILRNGAGRTILVRTELDALPVEEKTGLPYASKNAGVMHACGHDLHMACFVGAARTLAQLKERWHGTLMFVGQPAEERVGGAHGMLVDGLYERFGKPDLAIALHDTPDIAAGQVGVTAGPLLASADTVDVVMRGIGGHGAHPEATKDPIVAAAQFVLALQTIVSRQNPPQEPALITVGSIHGGTAPNIIPDEVKLALTVRTFNEDVRKYILSAIERTARGVAMAAGIPEDRAPIVKVSEDGVPVTFNDPALAGRVKASLIAALGPQNVVDAKPEMVSEDFGLFGLPGRQIPICMFRLGATGPERLRESRDTRTPLPSLHSSRFAPVLEPALRTGVTAMTAVLVDLMSQ